ncbi:hypothetical protein GCM10029992_03730 [Glycomyces albus]
MLAAEGSVLGAKSMHPGHLGRGALQLAQGVVDQVVASGAEHGPGRQERGAPVAGGDPVEATDQIGGLGVGGASLVVLDRGVDPRGTRRHRLVGGELRQGADERLLQRHV